jgi:transcription initiation factor TFIID TATA-box-binding protein
MASAITTRNCVASAHFGCEIDVDELCVRKGAILLENTNIDAVKLKLLDSTATALVYRTCKVIVTGVDSEELVRGAMALVLEVVKDVAPRAAYNSVCVDTIVGTAELGFEVDMQMAYDWMSKRVNAHSVDFNSASPESGLRFNPEDFLDGLRPLKYLPPIRVLIFEGGRVIVSGATSREDLETTWAIVLGIVKPFNVTNALI